MRTAVGLLVTRIACVNPHRCYSCVIYLSLAKGGMEGLVVSAATGALKPILEKLIALVRDEYNRFKRVRGEVEFLTKELTAMHAFLLKMSEEENPSVQDKAFMKEVREMSYDIEDSLDEFMHRVDGKSTKPDGFIKKIKGLLAKTKGRSRMAKVFQDFKDKVKQAGDRHARYRNGPTVSNANKTTVDLRALAIFKDVSELVGIDRPKHEVIKLLKDDQGHIPPEQSKVVSIVGVGGLGKTTIAKQVYEDLKREFECRAFVSVSRNPDETKILRTILSEVKHTSYYETEAGSIEKLIHDIREYLEKKRYFIVIDDIWDVKAWETFQWAFPKNSCGSMIITTTRKHDVAKACYSSYGGSLYELRPLSGEDSERLFRNRIFGLGEECPSNLETVSRNILTKCGGLPLAIIAISGLLANKAQNGVHSTKEWEQVESSIGHGLERDASVKGMMEILSLSYFDLPYHLKACLLYLSVFPEDYRIDKYCLVRRWVAEGFVCPEPAYTLYESGEKCFNELINRNLVLPGTIDEVTGEVESCMVHDTILDFIVSKSLEDNFVTIQGVPTLTPQQENKVRRLSLQGFSKKICQGEATLLSNQNYSNIRSLITFDGFVGPPHSLLDFRHLRVLDLNDYMGFLNHHITNIGELFQLKYLRLTGTAIELPEQIGELQYLETLDLTGCCKTKLPTTIVRLKSLVNLLLDGETTMPCGIRNMQALQELNGIYVDRIVGPQGFWDDIGELTEMRNLTVLWFFHDEIDKASYVEDIKKMVSSIQRLKRLQSLYVNVGGDDVYTTLDVDDVMMEEPWSANMRKLVLDVCVMSRVPSWMKSLVDLEILNLIVEKIEKESLDVLGGLPVLGSLKITIEFGKNIRPSRDEASLLICRRYGYPRLRHLEIRSRSTVVDNGVPFSNSMLMFEAGSMPMLEQLHISFDADITFSVTAVDVGLGFGLKHLHHLTGFDCLITGSEMTVRLAQHVIRKALDKHPKLCLRNDTIAALTPESLPPALADLLERVIDYQEESSHVIKNSVLTLPTNLSFAFPIESDHRPAACHHASKIASSRGHRQGRKSRLTPCRQWQSQPLSSAVGTVSEPEVPDQVIPPAGARTSDFLDPQLAAGFAFGAGSSSAAPAELRAGYKPWQPTIPAAPSPAPIPRSWNMDAFHQALSNLSIEKPFSNKLEWSKDA